MTEEEPIDWNKEACHIIEDVKGHLKHIEIASKQDIKNGILLNLSILDEKDFCVLLNDDGKK
jgi:hypothetical protein